MARKTVVTILILVLGCIFMVNGCKKKEEPVTPKKAASTIEKVEKAVEKDVNAVN